MLTLLFAGIAGIAGIFSILRGKKSKGWKVVNVMGRAGKIPAIPAIPAIRLPTGATGWLATNHRRERNGIAAGRFWLDRESLSDRRHHPGSLAPWGFQRVLPGPFLAG